MNKAKQMFVPGAMIVIGALLTLMDMNLLANNNGAVLTLGIIGLVIGLAYLGLGIIRFLMGDKLSDKALDLFDLCAVIGLPIFTLVSFIITVALIYDQMGPTAWVLSILGMLTSLGFGVCYALGKLMGSPIAKRLSIFLCALFGLTLLMDILFDSFGAPIQIGDIALVTLIIYSAYVSLSGFLLKEEFGASSPKEEPIPAAKEPKEEEPQPEEPAE